MTDLAWRPYHFNSLAFMPYLIFKNQVDKSLTAAGQDDKKQMVFNFPDTIPKLFSRYLPTITPRSIA